MTGRILVAAISICIGACASSGAEAPSPAATASSASVDAVASDKPAAPPAGELHELDAPDVALTANVLPGDESDNIVCRKERATGTKMSRTVCRKRADIEARAADAQEATRKMQETGSQLERGKTISN